MRSRDSACLKNVVLVQTNPGPWPAQSIAQHSQENLFLILWDYVGIAWTCHYQLLRSLDERGELRSSSLTSAITCVGGHLWKERVSLLTVLPGLQDQHWRPHLCLHSTTASVRLTKGILFLGSHWATSRNTHWPNLTQVIYDHMHRAALLQHSSHQVFIPMHTVVYIFVKKKKSKKKSQWFIIIVPPEKKASQSSWKWLTSKGQIINLAITAIFFLSVWVIFVLPSGVKRRKRNRRPLHTHPKKYSQTQHVLINSFISTWVHFEAIILTLF